MVVPAPPAEKVESPSGMDVDMMADQLSQQLQVDEIDDIDLFDRDNPQLCADYVKEIYTYMMKLEVRAFAMLSHPEIPFSTLFEIDRVVMGCNMFMEDF